MRVEIRSVENGWVVGEIYDGEGIEPVELNKIYKKGLPHTELIFFDFKKALDYVEELKEEDE